MCIILRRARAFSVYLADTALLKRKQAIVEELLAAATASPTYWNDVFTKLELEAHVDDKPT
jgi:hypothetical protein